jgi:hypothetical protein
LHIAKINGHRVATLPGPARQQPSLQSVCLGCGTRFTERLEIEYLVCPAGNDVHSHDLVGDPDDGLLYCLRCPLVAYDLNDVATEPTCPMPLDRD